MLRKGDWVKLVDCPMEAGQMYVGEIGEVLTEPNFDGLARVNLETVIMYCNEQMLMHLSEDIELTYVNNTRIVGCQVQQ